MELKFIYYWKWVHKFNLKWNIAQAMVIKVKYNDHPYIPRMEAHLPTWLGGTAWCCHPVGQSDRDLGVKLVKMESQNSIHQKLVTKENSLFCRKLSPPLCYNQTQWHDNLQDVWIWSRGAVHSSHHFNKCNSNKIIEYSDILTELPRQCPHLWPCQKTSRAPLLYQNDRLELPYYQCQSKNSFISFRLKE